MNVPTPGHGATEDSARTAERWKAESEEERSADCASSKLSSRRLRNDARAACASAILIEVPSPAASPSDGDGLPLLAST